MLGDLVAKLYDVSVVKRERSGIPRPLPTQNVGLRSSKPLGNVGETYAAEFRYLWTWGSNHVIPIKRRFFHLEGITGGVR